MDETSAAAIATGRGGRGEGAGCERSHERRCLMPAPDRPPGRDPPHHPGVFAAASAFIRPSARSRGSNLNGVCGHIRAAGRQALCPPERIRATFPSTSRLMRVARAGALELWEAVRTRGQAGMIQASCRKR